MVINIRGTSGSGKTFVVRSLMLRGQYERLGDQKKPEAYRLDLLDSKPIFIIGSYENTCGGCDAISTQDEICRRVEAYAPHGHVLVEGLLMSHLFSRYAMLDRRLAAQGIPFVWAFLDTPLHVCLERVERRREERRLAKKNPPEYKPLDPKNTSDKWRDCRIVHGKCVNMKAKDWREVNGFPPTKLDARWVPYEESVETVLGWLREAER